QLVGELLYVSDRWHRMAEEQVERDLVGAGFGCEERVLETPDLGDQLRRGDVGTIGLRHIGDRFLDRAIALAGTDVTVSLHLSAQDPCRLPAQIVEDADGD